MARCGWLPCRGPHPNRGAGEGPGGLHRPGRRGGWGPLAALTCEGRIQGRQSGQESRGEKGPSSGPGT